MIESKHEQQVPLPGIERRWFYKVAQYFEPYEHTRDIYPDKALLDALRAKRVDLFSFIERSFLNRSTPLELGFTGAPKPLGCCVFKGLKLGLSRFPDGKGPLSEKTERTLKTRLVNVDERIYRKCF